MFSSSLQEGTLVCLVTHSRSPRPPCSMGYVAVYICLYLCVSVHVSAVAHSHQKRESDVITGSRKPPYVSACN